MKDTKESTEDYLERILMLEEKQQEIHAVDLAQSMNFTKASISIALKKLEGLGYLTIDEKHHIHLTNEGREIASGTYERHKVIGSLLVSLGVDEIQAYEDACKIEHDISEETFAALKMAQERLKK